MATTLCDLAVRQDLVFDCDNLPAAGLEIEAALINVMDLDKAASELTRDKKANTIADLVIKSDPATLRGYVVQKQADSFNGTHFELVAGTYSNKFNHMFNFVNFDSSADGKAAENMIANGRFVVVIKTQSGVEDAKYEVLGFDTGLTCTAMTHDYEDEANEGLTIITLTSGAEPYRPMVWFDPDAASMDDKFNELISA